MLTSLEKLYGAPGILLGIALGAIVWLAKKVFAVQDARIADTQTQGEKYAQRLSDMTVAVRDLTAVINSAIARLK